MAFSLHQKLSIACACDYDKYENDKNRQYVRTLLDRGAVVCPQHIISAIKSKNKPLLRMLMKTGHCHIDYQDENGDSFLFYANWDVTRLLIKLGIDVNLINNQGQTVLDNTSCIKERKRYILTENGSKTGKQVMEEQDSDSDSDADSEEQNSDSEKQDADSEEQNLEEQD